MICDNLDMSDCDGIDQLFEALTSLDHPQSKYLVDQSKFTIQLYPNSLLNFTNHIKDFLDIEQHIIEIKDYDVYSLLLQQINNYSREADFIYTIIEKYLEGRTKDNYKEVLYKDAQSLIQLRQEKVFMIQLLILSVLSQELPSDSWNTFDIFLDSVSKQIRLNAALKFASIRIKTAEMLTNAISLLDELHEHGKQPLKDTGKRSNNVSLTRNRSYTQEINYSKIYSTTMMWFFTELQINQMQCRELIPNLRFIVKNYVKQFSKLKDLQQNRQQKSYSIFAELKKRMSSATMKLRTGVIDLPNLGPMELLSSYQMFDKDIIKELLDEDQIKHIEAVTKQIDTRLNDKLFGLLTGQIDGIEFDQVQSEDSNTPKSNALMSQQSAFKTFQPSEDSSIV